MYFRILILLILTISIGLGQEQYDNTGNLINFDSEVANHRDLGDIIHSCDFNLPYYSPEIDFYDNYLWLTFYAFSIGDYSSFPYLYKINIETCEIEETIDFFPSEIISACEIEWINGYLWVADCSANELGYGGNDIIYKLDSSGNIITSFPSNDGPNGLAWDGDYLWYTSWETEQIYKVDSDDGEVIYSISAASVRPKGLEFTNGYLWLRSRDFDNNIFTIYNMDPYIGIINESFISNDVGSIALDEQYLWSASIYSTILSQIDIGYEGNDSGCTDPYACNYDPDAIEDDGSCEYYEDCFGECGGDALEDDCGVCEGGNGNMDCAGECFGNAMVDSCGVCDGFNQDMDECGVCFGNNEDMDCTGACFGNAVGDDCGVCDGDNSTCTGCSDPEALNYD